VFEAPNLEILPAATLEGAMTIQELARLIASYRWLSEELAAQTSAGADLNCAHIKAEMEATFLRIVQQPAENPYVSCAQIDFLVSAMAEPGSDDATRALLCDMTLTHLRRLTKTLGRGDHAAPPEKRRKDRGASGLLGRYPLRTGSA